LLRLDVEVLHLDLLADRALLEPPHLALKVADAALDRAQLGVHALDLADLVLDRLLALPGPGDHLVLAVEEPERAGAHGPEQDRLADELEHPLSLRFGREGNRRETVTAPAGRARARAGAPRARRRTRPRSTGR